MSRQLVNSFEVRFENELDNWWLRMAEATNRYTPPMDPEAYLRENEFNEEEVWDLQPPDPAEVAYLRENNENDDNDLPPPLLRLPPASPSYSPTPPAYYNENDIDDLPPPLLRLSPARPTTPPAYYTDSEDEDTVIVIYDEEDIANIMDLDDDAEAIIDLVSDDEPEVEERPTVICWAEHGYRIYLQNERHVEVSCNVIFDEKIDSEDSHMEINCKMINNTELNLKIDNEENSESEIEDEEGQEEYYKSCESNDSEAEVRRIMKELKINVSSEPTDMYIDNQAAKHMLENIEEGKVTRGKENLLINTLARQ
ncbi:hypothetical protein NQ314_008057 [Rhamnusium bicolor]|uniref:Uncharacterized protein n=1 Tax=Rhamnusium bicolor TaxID=1586634 RepID=A0AAV8YEB6_9CUCU|nr:hypothetical protein NQ314_008057 [Rhamnusium bicolor]